MSKESQNLADQVSLLKPGVSAWEINWSALWRYRYMFYYLMKRDIVVKYKQTLLGPLWLVLHPALMSFLFTLVFGRIAGISTDGIPSFLFYFCNNIFWSFLISVYGETSTVYTKGKALMGKVYFPRLIVPFAALGGNAFKFLIQTGFLIILFVYFLLKGEVSIPFTGLLWLPLVILQLSLIGLGTGFIFAWMTLKYRDLGVIASLFTQGWMYLSPVAFPLSEVPGTLGKIMALNPVTSALEIARHGIFGTEFPAPWICYTGWVVALLIFIVGLLNFNVTQRKFIDIA